MTSRRYYSRVIGASALLAGLSGSIALDNLAIAQRPATVGPTEAIPRVVSPGAPASVRPTEAIPREFKSWSLFLVCGPGWILRNKDEGVSELYQDFETFGAAIGPDNVAIWFWKQKKEGLQTADNIDLDRSSRYCEKYHLLPSSTPLVLVTTHYPDDPGEGDKFVVSLNDLSASESAGALDKITDQLMQSGLDQRNIDSAAFWRAVWSASATALSAAGCYLNKVSISIHTVVLNAEISHSEQESCQNPHAPSP